MVVENITHVREAAGETTQSAETVQGSVAELRDCSDGLRTEIDTFLEKVQAA